MNKKLALLCDFGLDDAIAVLYLLENARDYEVIDILAVAGNFPLEITLNNAKRLLSHADIEGINIRVVDTAEVAQVGDNIPEIHGRDGMGDVLPEVYEEKTAVIGYSEWLAGIDSGYTVISLGPCTVTQDIIEKKGALPLIMMGGNIAEPPNYKGYEFNHGLNPAAFSASVKYATACATLDSCHNPLCDFNKITARAGGLLGRMIKRYIEMSNERREEICAAYDLLAVAYLLHPERFAVTKKTDKDGNLVPVLQYISDNPLL